MEYLDIMDFIVSERKRQGLTQVQMSGQMNCAQSHIARWETKRVEPSFKVIQEMLQVLGYTIKIVPKD